MKHLFVLIILGITMNNIAIAQFTGGGMNTTDDNSDAQGQKNDYKLGEFIVIVAAPTGAFGEYDLDKTFENAVGASTGLGFQLNSRNYFVKQQKPVKFGLYSSTSFSIHFMDEGYSDDVDATVTTPPLTGEFKLGPVVSYELTKNMLIDGYVKAGPVLALGPSFEIENQAGETVSLGFNEPSFSFFKVAFGSTYRINNFSIGLSFAPQTFDQEYYEDGEKLYDVELPMNTFRFLIGLTY